MERSICQRSLQAKKREGGRIAAALPMERAYAIFRLLTLAHRQGANVSRRHVFEIEKDTGLLGIGERAMVLLVLFTCELANDRAAGTASTNSHRH